MADQEEVLESRVISLLSKARNDYWHPDEKERFGALIVFPYNLDDPEFVARVVFPMKGVDYFKGRELYIMSEEFKPALIGYLLKNPDGAILARENGLILQNDTALVPDIQKVAKEMRKRYGVGCNEAYYEQLGFLETVGTRHCFAKAITYELGIKAITLSQKTGTIRMYDKGYTTKVFTVSPELNPNVNTDVYKEIEQVPNEHKIVAPRRKHRYVPNFRQARRVS